MKETSLIVIHTNERIVYLSFPTESWEIHSLFWYTLALREVLPLVVVVYTDSLWFLRRRIPFGEWWLNSFENQPTCIQTMIESKESDALDILLNVACARFVCWKHSSEDIEQPQQGKARGGPLMEDIEKFDPRWKHQPSPEKKFYLQFEGSHLFPTHHALWHPISACFDMWTHILL